MKNLILLYLTILLTITIHSYGQTNSKVLIPNFNDKYSDYVKKLEAGETDIDFQDFRFSFIESNQFKLANKKSTEFYKLKNEMYLQINKSNSEELIIITKQMLSIDYTSMLAHKILQQTYKMIGDTVNATKYKTIEFGLLNSIVKNGDGKSCATAWPVIQIDEEYFILQMLSVELIEQSVNNVGGLCDKMKIKTEEGGEENYFFETTKVFEGYEKLRAK